MVQSPSRELIECRSSPALGAADFTGADTHWSRRAAIRFMEKHTEGLIFYHIDFIDFS
jgi:hypothetical protein